MRADDLLFVAMACAYLVWRARNRGIAVFECLAAGALFIALSWVAPAPYAAAARDMGCVFMAVGAFLVARHISRARDR